MQEEAKQGAAAISQPVQAASGQPRQATEDAQQLPQPAPAGPQQVPAQAGLPQPPQGPQAAGRPPRQARL